MTTQGDSRSIPASAEPGRRRDLALGQDPDQSWDADLHHGFERDLGSELDLDVDLDQGRDPGRRRAGGRARSGGGSSRRVATWCAVVLVVGAVGWVVTRPNPGDWLPGLGPSSKDAANSSAVVGNPPPTSSADPNPFLADRYFPSTRLIDQNGYKARRSGGRQGSDCAETLQDSAKALLHATGCQGYLTVSFSRLDSKVLTSVTVLRFADDATGRKVAELLGQQPGALQFVMPDSTIAAPSPATKGQSTPAPRVEAVHRYVTVTTSRPADGVTATPVELDEATRAASYTAGAAFVWQ